MGKEIITTKQGACLITLFIMGSTLVTGTGSEAKSDTWIAILLGMLFALPILLIYSRILFLFPEKNLFEILQILFGTILGKIIGVPMTWYGIHLGALVLRDFSEFISIAALPETPVIVPVLCLSLLCVWGVKVGIETLGRWAEFMLPILVTNIIVVIALSMTIADFDNLRPVLHNNLKPVIKNAFSVFAFPFAETALFLMVGFKLKAKNSMFKTFLIGLFIGGGMVLTVGIRNLLILGPDFINGTYFPSYIAVGLINIGNFLQRMEILVSLIFLFAGFVKISICLLGVSQGVAYLFNIENYRLLTAPIGLLMIALSTILYKNNMEMIDWAFKVYMYYAFPFQVVLPMIIWIFAEIKIKNQAKETIN